MSEYEPRRMSEEEAWEMLHAQEFGRLAFHLADEVHITPVNYAVDGERLIFRTAEGSKLLGVTMNHDVAFEIDEYNDEHARSVIVRGRAHELRGHEAEATDQLPLRPWVGTTKVNIIAIDVDEISGRAFHLQKPWATIIRHATPEE